MNNSFEKKNQMGEMIKLVFISMTSESLFLGQVKLCLGDHFLSVATFF